MVGIANILRSMNHSGVAAFGARPGAVIRNDLALALRLDQCKAVAAYTGRLRLDHAKQRASRDGGVGSGATRLQHLDRGQCRQRVRGSDHGVLCVNRGAAGEMKISHAKGSFFISFLCAERRNAAAFSWHTKATGAMRGTARDASHPRMGFASAREADKPRPCSRSPLCTNLPRCRISGSYASRCARFARVFRSGARPARAGGHQRHRRRHGRVHRRADRGTAKRRAVRRPAR